MKLSELLKEKKLYDRFYRESWKGVDVYNRIVIKKFIMVFYDELLKFDFYNWEVLRRYKRNEKDDRADDWEKML